jgi:hypothetical protein
MFLPQIAQTNENTNAIRRQRVSEKNLYYALHEKQNQIDRLRDFNFFELCLTLLFLRLS